MYYHAVPQPAKTEFNPDVFIAEATVPNMCAGISSDVKISRGVAAVCETLYTQGGLIAGTIIFIPYLRKDAIKWPNP